MVFELILFLLRKFVQNTIMKLRNTIIIFLAVAFLGCNNKPQPPVEGIQNIVLKESKDILPISSFAEKVDYVELKAVESGLEIGVIEDVKVLGDDLIVKHRMSGNESFLRFTKSGEYVIELVGTKTPQIKNPFDIITYKDGFAVLAENGIHAVSKDGKYLQKLERGNMPGTHFFFKDDAFYVVNQSKPGNVLYSFPAKNKAQGRSALLPDPVLRNTYSSVEQFGKEQVHYFSVLSDSVYSYKKENIAEPVYSFSGDEMPTFAEVCRNLPDKEDKEILRYLRETEHVIVRKYFENRDYIFLTYWVGSDPTAAIFDKKSNEIRYFGFGVNDIDGGVWDEAICMTDKNELYIPITAYKVGGHKISNKKAKGFDRLQQHIAASGNPVIMRCKLR